MPILLNITNITQYYQYYSILHAKVILERSWILLKCYPYYSILPTSKLRIQYYSIFRTLKTVLFQFKLCQYSSILQAISKIHQYSLILPEQLADVLLYIRVQTYIKRGRQASPFGLTKQLCPRHEGAGPPYSARVIWSIALQAFSRTMTGRCLASWGEAEGRQDTVNEGG